MAFPITPAMLRTYAEILDTRSDWPAARTQAARLREVAAALTRGETVSGRLIALNLSLFVIDDYVVDLDAIKEWAQSPKPTARDQRLAEAASALVGVTVGALIENQGESSLIALARTHLSTLKGYGFTVPQSVLDLAPHDRAVGCLPGI